MIPARGFLKAGLAATICAIATAVGAADYTVDIHKPDKAFPGTTVFGDESDPGTPRIVEVDMSGKILWSYDIPSHLGRSRATDVEWIPASDTFLFTRAGGVYEVNRAGRIVWSCNGPSSHDADRLPNGNTLVVWGWGKDSADPEVRELDRACNVVWKWHAAKHVAGEKRLFDQEGLTHANSAVRLANGNTLVSLRNYYMLVEVDRAGRVVWKLPGLFTTPHDPEILANGNILVNTRGPQVIRELTPGGRMVWEYRPNQKDVQTVRYNHRLPNGNVLFVERTTIVEVTPEGEIVWRMRLPGVGTDARDRGRWLYKAERIPAGKRPEPGHAFAAPSETLKATGEVPVSLDRQREETARKLARSMMRRMDTDGDRRISRREFTGRAAFGEIDSNGDGFVSMEEAVAHHTNRLTRTKAGSSGGKSGFGRGRKD